MYKSQYWLREGYFTGLALMKLIEDITNNLNNNLITTGALLICRKHLIPKIISFILRNYAIMVSNVLLQVELQII